MAQRTAETVRYERFPAPLGRGSLIWKPEVPLPPGEFLDAVGTGWCLGTRSGFQGNVRAGGAMNGSWGGLPWEGLRPDLTAEGAATPAGGFC